MKRILPSILFSVLMMVLLAIPEVVKAQDPCAISCDQTMPVCSETQVRLSIVNPDNVLYRYSWTPGNFTTNSIKVKPFETTTYHVYVTDTAGMAVCDNSFTVEVLPRFNTAMRQLELTCGNSESNFGRTAEIKVNVTDAQEPLEYYWEEGSGHGRWSPLSPMHVDSSDPSRAMGLKAYKWYRVEITDGRGCVQYDSIYTRAYLAPVVEITCDPGDTVFIQNPDATFSFENLSQDTLGIDHFTWTFEYNNHKVTFPDVKSPVFTFVETGTYYPTLTIIDDLGCDTVYTKEIRVNPVKLKIPSVFTPNADGVNDTFVITLASGSDTPGANSSSKAQRASDELPLNTYYKSTELMVMNRWGRIVYHSTDYQNDWDGGGLADGTYFYVLKCKGLKEEIQYQGSVMILTTRK